MNKMQGDDPPYLSVGTAVSAKYKGAFCEAKVSKVVRLVKCKVTYKMGLGTATVSDENIKGALRTGQLVQVKHPDKKEYVEATITKIQDCSQYTVVFDDGDITTLRRTALCLKSGRHFNESETLDQLPLTHPEHFGNPVVGGRRGRRTRHLKDDSSEGEVEEENEPDLEQYVLEVGRVVCIEASDKKKSKDNWFPGLVVMPSAQPTVRINVKDEFLVRSFKDGRYYTVPQKEVSEFTREIGAKVDSPNLGEAVEKALKYLDNNELPVHWERGILFSSNHQGNSSDSDENMTESSEDETPEEKDHFVAQLYKFMDDSNTPLNKSPTIASRDVDLHRLFRLVSKFGGYNRVTNKNKWRAVTCRLRLPNNLSVHSQVKQVYRKCLHSYEAFHRTLGVTMHNHPRGAKKSRGRSLIRDKDRNTPANSPRPEKDDEPLVTILLEKKEEEKPPEEKLPEKAKGIKKYEFKPRADEEKKKKETSEVSDTNSSDATDHSETASTSRPRRLEMKVNREQRQVIKTKPPQGDKVKVLVEKFEEQTKKEEDEKVQQTRAAAKAQIAKSVKEKDAEKSEKIEKKIKEERKSPIHETPPKIVPKIVPKKEGEEKKRGRKRLNPEDKTSLSDSSTTDSSSTPTTALAAVTIGDKLKVFYGPTDDSKVTYEAKVIDEGREGADLVYKVHYAGWNSRYDEWIAPSRIAENLSAATKAKRLKQGTSGGIKATTPKAASKRGRGASVGSRSAHETPRSTTPSSVTSTSSRTKSPGTPATRSSRTTRQEANRAARTAAQLGEQTESESDATESDSDTIKTRSGGKSEDGEGPRTYRRKISKPSFGKLDRKKDDDEMEKDEDVPEKTKRTRKSKKSLESKETESDDDSGSPPKGRDFDLNQIRNELKGFTKTVKAAANESGAEKESASSDESSNAAETVKIKAEEENVEKEKIKEKENATSSSDDIYEFKEPEPFEFETRPKLADEKLKKRLVPRCYEDLEKSPKRKPVKEDVDVDKRRLKRTPGKKQEVEEDKNEEESKRTSLDPFDELVESPSFHSGKAKSDSKPKVIKALNLEEFDNLMCNEEDSRYQIDIDDTEESSGEPLFKHNKKDLFLDSMFPSYIPKIEEKPKSIENEEAAKATITSPINTPIFSDDDSNDELVLAPALSSALQDEKSDSKIKPSTSTTTSNSMDDSEDDIKLSEVRISKEPAVKISPALQETDTTALMEAIKSPPAILTKLEETIDINVKPTTKIADTLLQKLSMIENAPDDLQIDVIKPEEVKPKSPEKPKKVKPEPSKAKSKDVSPDVKKRAKKIVSREFIESESDSSDCEERLVIARSDEESSQTSSDVKQENKETETDSKTEVSKTEQNEPEAETKEEDSYLHSLLCEETIPGSPAPSTEQTDSKPKVKSTLEMPFASAPGSSNGNGGVKRVEAVRENKMGKEVQNRIQPMPLEANERERRDAAAVLDNTPPTTPESTLSNLSPRDDPGRLSPNVIDNDSCKSLEVDAEFSLQRRGPNKIGTYSEEDTLLNVESAPPVKKPETAVPSMCKKRRKSCKGSEDAVPAKRGRKPLNRSRHNSDSDDNSEHSMQGGIGIASAANMERVMRSPRPSKYNFYVELDPNLDSGQRIAILQQKLQDIRKTYADVKAELAIVERRRKKIRRREREAKLAAKQESVAA